MTMKGVIWTDRQNNEEMIAMVREESKHFEGDNKWTVEKRMERLDFLDTLKEERNY